ncbi:hypothetical protein ACFWG0_07495 [Streptomyces yangpuensis]|uniref:hypothetical protein n=1 Tax=Streptomyces yangpuensis TaxID=1648182 RepID=UPI0036627A8A
MLDAVGRGASWPVAGCLAGLLGPPLQPAAADHPGRGGAAGGGPADAAAAPESSEAPEAADPHERLHELTDLAPALAIRAAVTLGPVGLVRQGVREPTPAR